MGMSPERREYRCFMINIMIYLRTGKGAVKCINFSDPVLS